MPAPHTLDHDQNVYLVVTVSPKSNFYHNSAALAVHPALATHGAVGELHDIQLLSVSRQLWPQVQGDVVSALQSLEGVMRVDVQDAPRTRIKRGDDL